MLLRGKTVVVVGGSSGIGLATAGDHHLNRRIAAV